MQKRCACFRSPGATSQNHGYQPLSLTVGPLSMYGHLVAVWLKSNTVVGGRVVPLSAAATETGHPARPIYSHIDDTRRSFGASCPRRRWANVPACREDAGRTERGVTLSVSLTVDYLPCSDSAVCARGLCGIPNPAFRFVFRLNILKVTRADRTRGSLSFDRSRSLTSFRPFVSSSRRSGLGVSRDRRGTGGARAADNMTVAAPWPRGP